MSTADVDLQARSSKALIPVMNMAEPQEQQQEHHTSLQQQELMSGRLTSTSTSTMDMDELSPALVVPTTVDTATTEAAALSPDHLVRHAAVTNNLGCFMFQHGECVTAMQLFQESLQTLMTMQQPEESKDAQEQRTPVSQAMSVVVSAERCHEMEQLMQDLKGACQHEAQEEGCSAASAKPYPLLEHHRDVMGQVIRMYRESLQDDHILALVTLMRHQQQSRLHVCAGQGIPGLFDRDMEFASAPDRDREDESQGQGPTSNTFEHSACEHRKGLVFPDPFQVALDNQRFDGNVRTQGKARQDAVTGPLHSITVPKDQCLRASLFNWGLIRYHWGSPETAVQFFNQAAAPTVSAAAMGSSQSPNEEPPMKKARLGENNDSNANLMTEEDPILIASLNNMAQIYMKLNYSKAPERTRQVATEVLVDALTRGNVALASMYATIGFVREEEPECMSRIRKFMARTVMQLGHVHEKNGDYRTAMSHCDDAWRLLQSCDNGQNSIEMAAVWYNKACMSYQQGERIDALDFLDLFLRVAQNILEPNHPNIGDALNLKGQIYFEMGNLYVSLKALLEAVGIFRSHYGDIHPLVADLFSIIGKVLLAREEYDFSINSLRRALAIRQALLKEKDMPFAIAQILLDMGRAYHAQGNISDSLRIYKTVLALSQKYFGVRALLEARLEIIVGNLHLELDQLEEGTVPYLRAARIYREQGHLATTSFVRDQLWKVKLNFVKTAAAA